LRQGDRYDAGHAINAHARDDGDASPAKLDGRISGKLDLGSRPRRGDRIADVVDEVRPTPPDPDQSKDDTRNKRCATQYRPGPQTISP